MTQISYEAAIDACRARLGDLTYEAVLKDARILELEKQVADLEAELTRVRQQATAPTAAPAPRPA